MATPDPKARAVALDALQQALGLTAADAEEAFRNAQHLVHVRELLRHSPGVEVPGRGTVCPGCDFDLLEFPHLAHGRTCRVAAAWRAMGDPRGAEDLELAHEDALEDDGNIDP